MNVVETQKVLVADDDAINREVLGELLKPEYTVLPARNGVQALERAARHLPDLILLDVMMPDMDGYEVLRRLRADPQTAQIAVIFISGLDRPEDEANGLKMGASDYIVKPFNYPELLLRTASLESRLSGRVASVLTVGSLTMDLAARAVTLDGVLIHLPGKEYELLSVLARDPNKVNMKEDLMERIWGYRNCGTRTLDSHASRLRRRLTAVADGPWVINNWSVGYSLRTVLQ